MSAKTITYILDCRKNGFSDEQIRKKLLETGYDAKIVDRFFKELDVEKIPKRWFPLLPALALILIVAILALHFRTGNEMTVALTPVDSMTEPGCAVDAGGWSFYSNCAITKTIDIPKKLQGKPLTMVIEASGTPLHLPQGRMIDTYTFTGMSAKEFLERDWSTEAPDVGLAMSHYDSTSGVTTTSTYFEPGQWSGVMTPQTLSTYLKEKIAHLGYHDPSYGDFILENVILEDNVLILYHLMRERYNTALPVFNVSIVAQGAKNSHMVTLSRAEWEDYTIELNPCEENVRLTIEFLNDMWIPTYNADGTANMTEKVVDRNLFIRELRFSINRGDEQ